MTQSSSVSNSETYRESRNNIGWDEETCRRLDRIAREDHSYIATWDERRKYENNWKHAFEHSRTNQPYESKIGSFWRSQNYPRPRTKRCRATLQVVLANKFRQRPVWRNTSRWNSWSSSASSSTNWRVSSTVVSSQNGKNTNDFQGCRVQAIAIPL